MKNINKNAVQALWVDGKAFLAHKAIESFSMGQGDFTIEVSFICNEVRDCLFYAQEQGFAFGIRNGLLYFELDGMGSITQKEGVAIVTDVLLSAAVSCREGKLSLYLEGLPIADQVETTSEATKNSGTYEIGKGLVGYIVELRLRSCGMTDQEILSDNGMGLTECEAIEFWTDFTSVQYRDKSHNALGLSTTQGIVKCVNVTSCTSLELQGGFVTMAKKSYGEAYTLLFKIYPQLESYTKMYAYSAVGADGTIFSIGVESDSEGDKQIFVENGGVVYQGNSALPLMAWTDIGLRVENGNAQLYIDGVRQLEFVFSGKLDNITSIIGIKPFEKKIVCKDGFWGYLDYFAEFNCALSEEKIAYYAEEQPYIFDESISSLYAFYCGDPIDLLTGNMLLSIGSGKAVFEKELNNMSAPIGMDLRVPQEVCAEWQELSEYEQWAMTTAMDMVRDTYSQSMGLAMPEGMVPIEQTATKQIGQHYEEEIKEVTTVWTPENQDAKSNKFISGSLSGGTGGVGVAVAGVTVMGGAGAAAVGGAVTTKFTTMGTAAVAAVGGVGAIGGTLIGVRRNLGEDVAIAKKKMPKNDRAEIEIVSILFNHCGDPTKGSIHFHSDAELKEPSSMKYYFDGNEDDINMLLILSELGEKLKVILEIRNKSTAQFSSTLYMTSDVRFSKGNVNVVLEPGETKEFALELELKDRSILGDMAEVELVHFQFSIGVNQTLVDINQRYAYVYLLKNVPIKPWDIHRDSAYDNDVKDYPSLVFLYTFVAEEKDVNLQLGEIKEEFNKILNKIYDGGELEYISDSIYTVRYNQFKLRDFLISVKNKKEATKVNCTDCANIVSLIATVLGIKMNMNLIYGYQGYDCNPIMLIPSNEWSDDIGFSYHQVAFYTKEERFSNDAKIYDLCLKIDAGDYPGQMEELEEKHPFLSGGYKAYQSDDIIVQIPKRYTAEYYLERLIESGQEAAFTSKQISTVFWTGLQPAPNDLYTELMQQYIQSYGLDDEKYTVEISQLEVQQSLLLELGLETKSESFYGYDWSAPDGMRVTWFRNAEHLPAGEYLASVLMRFSCRLTEKEAPELGERVFYGPDLLITYFEGSAYAINCKDMEKAEEMAHNLKSSMI